MLFNVKVSKLNTVLAFDTEKLPVASVNYLIEYGLKQSLNDAHAGKQQAPRRHALAHESRNHGKIPKLYPVMRFGEALIRVARGRQ